MSIEQWGIYDDDYDSITIKSEEEAVIYCLNKMEGMMYSIQMYDGEIIVSEPSAGANGTIDRISYAEFLQELTVENDGLFARRIEIF